MGHIVNGFFCPLRLIAKGLVNRFLHPAIGLKIGADQERIGLEHGMHNGVKQPGLLDTKEIPCD